MVLLPEYLRAFQSEAEQLLASGSVHEIEFSGSTYQVQIIDPNTQNEQWAFLQLDSKGEIKDCFCSCEKAEDFSYCVHQAIAFLSIYNAHPEPLHLRFQRSLWNTLCQLYAERMGCEPDLLTKIKPGYYRRISSGGKTVFWVKAQTPAAIDFLHNLIEERQQETEETSLKFSNLPEEEMVLWREGRPSFQLSYELSFWRDLAHWLMLLQEKKEPYSIAFNYSAKGLPNQLTLSFSEVELSFYLSEANLPEIIPALETVDSPLKIFRSSQNAIEAICYDKINASLIIEPKKSSSKKSKEKEKSNELSAPETGPTIDGWVFAPGKGFYALMPHHLLDQTVLSGERLIDALNKDSALIGHYLKDATVTSTPTPASYSIAFDANWNLHITCYAFTPGDLSLPHSHCFDDWVYIDDEGFYRLTNKRFDEVETVIAFKEVSEFVRQERAWLNTQEGFHTHITSIEAQLTYTLSADNRLTFKRLLSTIGSETETKDFGSWIYISGRGFYSKKHEHVGLSLRPDATCNANQIPLFIYVNQEELKLVPNFFSTTCPVADMRLKVELLGEDSIVISPEYKRLPEYQERSLRFFDDYVYVDGEGFHELPIDRQIPERFHQTVHIEGDALDLFLGYELDGLRPFTAHIDPRLSHPQHLTLETNSVSKDDSSGAGWYALRLYYQSELGAVQASALWTAIKKKKRFVFTPAGLIDLEDRRFQWLKMLPKTRLDRRNNDILLPTFELLRLNAFDEINISDTKTDNLFQSKLLLKEITEFHPPSDPDYSGLKCVLRPYQEVALKWLWFLYNYNLSGLLCDDMGLGKTHQTMALFDAIFNDYKRHREGERCYFLVICPTSVIFHWQEKLKQFLPEQRVFTFYGNQRSLEGFQEGYDILLTSYGIWRIEEEKLKGIPFEVAVFDEIQIAKNHQSRIYATLLSVTARMRIGLTGTPIENHLRELKTLFDLIIPGYMPKDSDYRELFVKPIEKESDHKKKELLSRFIKPFILRRKKEDVLPDLPEKTEEVFHCVLLPDQQVLYNEVLMRSRQMVLEQLEEEGSPIPYVHIFSILSSLKQICNHPATYLKTPDEYKNYASGKWDLFVELINEARESRQKIVVFTQYLFMLDIFEHYLNELGVGFATIRGATTKRGEQLQRFNSDPNCEVFLGSLQAAGLGVDLTAGSVVIHYDRWWNAARENQATDRVHRIGQTRGVQVFKLVTRGTFEERIDALIAQKGKLMEDVVGTDEREIVKSFSRDEIIQLLQLVDIDPKE